MSSFADKSVLVYDSGGLFVSLAEVLARSFGRVGYFCPWETSFPDGRELIIGYGVPGLERIKYFDRDYAKFDLLVFPDVWAGDLQEDLRRRGHRVWGSGMGSELELLRAKTKKRFPELGLDVNPWKEVVGTKALREYLSEHPNQIVKVSTLRGLGETFEAESLESVEGLILDLEDRHLEIMEIMPFVCENKVKSARELGYDGYAIDGQFPERSMFGCEKKDRAYFGMAADYSDLPDPLLTVNEALSPVLKSFGSRQFLSTEVIEEEGTGNCYLIDVTHRHASPAGEVYCETYDNLSEIMWEGAEGKLINPEITRRYGAQIILTSEWAEEHPQKVFFPEEIRPFVKLYNHCRVKGVDWVVPQLAKMKHIGSVVYVSDDADDAVERCKELAEQVHGFDIEYDEDALDDACEEMKAVGAQ